MVKHIAGARTGEQLMQEDMCMRKLVELQQIESGKASFYTFLISNRGEKNMFSIRRYFWTGIYALLMSASLVQAETTKRFIPSPALEQYQPPAASQPAPPTAMQPVPSTSSQPAPPTEFQSAGQGRALPDLYVSEYTLDPSPPSREAVVDVRIRVYNQGGAASGPFTVQWWPSDDYPKPGCTWRVESLVPNGGRILKCSGYVYPSWYGRINTGVYVDSGREVQEISTRNNKMYRETQVTK